MLTICLRSWEFKMKMPGFTNQFEKDMKLCEKQNKDLTKIKAVMFDIIVENKLHEKYQDHKLSGNWKNHKECHIEPDWLLMYVLHKGVLVVTATATGSHADLFGM